MSSDARPEISLDQIMFDNLTRERDDLAEALERAQAVVEAGKWLLMDVTPMDGDLCKTCCAHDPDHHDDCTFTEFRDALASLPDQTTKGEP
jgi:hypothetical protein